MGIEPRNFKIIPFALSASKRTLDFLTIFFRVLAESQGYVLTRAQERMGELVGLIAKIGVPTVLVAELEFIIIRGHVNFQYPRDDDPEPPAPKPPPPASGSCPTEIRILPVLPRPLLPSC